jgi:hypothetical protein
MILVLNVNLDDTLDPFRLQHLACPVHLAHSRPIPVVLDVQVVVLVHLQIKRAKPYVTIVQVEPLLTRQIQYHANQVLLKFPVHSLQQEIHSALQQEILSAHQQEILSALQQEILSAPQQEIPLAPQQDLRLQPLLVMLVVSGMAHHVNYVLA